MARGFESKSVADQQAEAEERREAEGLREARRNPPQMPPAEALRRRGLELARADALHRLEQTHDERYRAMLQKALADLDQQMSQVGQLV